MKFPRAVEGEGVVELWHFNKYFKNTTKKARQRNILEIFLLDTLKTTFSMENLTQTLKTQGPAPDPKCKLNISSFLTLPHLSDCLICTMNSVSIILLL